MRSPTRSREGQQDRLPRVEIQHCNRLLSSVQVDPYNSHLGLLRPERC